MPIYEGENPIKKSIASGSFARLYIFCGNEPYLKDHYLEKLVAAAVMPGLETFNLKKLDGAECDASDLIAAADQMPLMGGQNCCVVRGFLLAKLNAADCTALTDYAAKIPDTTVLIFYLNEDAFPPKQSREDAGTEDKGVKKLRKDLFDALLNRAFIAKLDRRSPQNLATLLIGGAKKRGCALSAKNAELMVNLCGTDLYTLMNELNKVAAYAAGGEITAETIHKVATKTLEATAFEIADNLFLGNLDRALQSLEILLEQKNPAQMILGSLIFPFIDIYRVKLADRYHRSNADLMKAFSYSGSFRLDKARRNGRNISDAAIRKCMQILDAADLCLKSRGGAESVVLEETLVKLGAALC